MREIFVESEYKEFRCPPGFQAGAGEVSVGEPLQGGRARSRPLYMHRLLAPEELTQEVRRVLDEPQGAGRTATPESGS